jgi:hypothetical protein
MISKQMALWTTKEGKKIRICDMEDSHLLNSIRLIERRVCELKANVDPPSFNGEMAQMHAEQMYLNFMDLTIEDFFPVYGKLILDALRRGLDRDTETKRSRSRSQPTEWIDLSAY